MHKNFQDELVGKIIADNHQEYQFNRYNLADRKKSLSDFAIGDQVEFDLYHNPRKNVDYASGVRPAGTSAFGNPQGRVEFKDFVYLETDKVASALTHILNPSFFTSRTNRSQYINEIYKTIAETYNGLKDGDFVHPGGNEARLTFPSGYTAEDGEPLLLDCIKNSRARTTNIPWYSSALICGGEKIEGSVFDLVNANWYAMADSINSVLKTPCPEDPQLLCINIDIRCRDRGSSLVWLHQGVPSPAGDADSLFVPTGFFESGGKEIYLYCKRKKGVNGFGWYFGNATFESASLEVYDKGDWLSMWAEMPDESKMLEDLQDQTLPEKWAFSHGRPYGILSNYLKYTFSHQMDQVLSPGAGSPKSLSIAYSADKKYASFNTGLPDRNTYQYLYAVFEKIDDPGEPRLHPLYFRPKYRFLGFTTNGSGGLGKTLSGNIYPLPTPPQYFDSRSATVWELDFNQNNQAQIPSCDDKHILISRCDRIPLDFYKSSAVAARSAKFQEILNSEISDSEKYRRIRQFLSPVFKNKADAETTNVYRELHENLIRKIDITIRKLSWNWRAVVPCFNPEKNGPCYLLPISLCDPDKPDRALIATEKKFKTGRSYEIETVLSLDWAYLDARLVCSPESEWLSANTISEES